MRGNLETYIKCCSHKSKLFISFSSSIACFKTTVYMLVFFMRNVNMIYLCSFIISISIKNNIKSIEHVVSYLKLVVRVLKTILKKGQTKLCYHPPPRSTTIHHDPPPPTTSQICPPPPTNSQNISTTTYHFPRNGQPPRKSQNIFINLLLTLL